MRDVLKGATDQSTVIRIVDSTDGTPETGVVFNTSGIDLWYRREGGLKVSITEATLSALNDAHSDGGILHIGDGYYRLDLPDAAWATGADGVAIGGTVTGMVVIGSYHQLVDLSLSGQSAADLKDFADAGYDPSTNKVQGVVLVDTLTTYTGNTPQTGDSFTLIGATGSGLTSLASQASVDALNDFGAAEIRNALGMATADLDSQLAAIVADTAEIGAAGAGLTALATQASVNTIDDFLDTEIAAILAAVDTEVAAILAIANKLDTALELDGAVYRLTLNALELAPTGGSAPTAVEIADEVQTRTIAAVTTVATTTNLTNLPSIPANWLTAAGTAADFVTEIQTAAAAALTAYDPPTNAEFEARTLLSAAYGTAANQTTIAGYIDTEIAAILAAVDTEIAAIKAKTDNLPAAPAATGDIPTVSQIWTTALTEAYAADGAAFTGAQALYMLFGLLAEVSAAGTTLTVKKLDGSTTAMTFTLNDASSPTSITRAT